MLWQPEIPLLDVRSPAEYERGHIPGALSFPLFSNEERARVGTLYKREGQQEALLEGLRIVGPKMADMLSHAIALAPQRQVALHCWRGGLRSSSVAWLLHTAGFQVEVLKGGYKAYRQDVHRFFTRPFRFVLLGGQTGSGKTEVLQALRQLGEQVIDLESLASHRGSAFGALGMPPQPSIEQFENTLHHELKQFNLEKVIWVEDESRKIGTIVLHEALWKQMQAAPCILIETELQDRVKRLMVEYGSHPPEALEKALQKIAKRLGGQHVKRALEALKNGDLELVVQVALRYYDKAYGFALLEREQNRLLRNQPFVVSAQQTALALVNFSKTLQW